MAAAPKRILTSGDLTADRRAEYAAMLTESGDYAAAAELMEQALELAPTWAAGWFRRGEFCQKAGNNELAIGAFRKALKHAPEDIFGAGLKLVALGSEPLPNLPPSQYVEGLFDDYAERFDTALVEKLNYSVPEKLSALMCESGRQHFDLAIDLGCGTGLLGEKIHPFCAHLEGYDLSENMLVKAKTKGIYHHLKRADLSLPVLQSGLLDGLSMGRADLVTAADVMMYLGDLEAAFANVSALLAPGGLFAFSVEKAFGEAGFELRPSLRYAHSEQHVRKSLAAHHLDCLTLIETMIRMDGTEPIMGFLFLAQRR